MKKWLVRAGILAGVLFLVAMVAGLLAARRFEPFVLAEAKRYMSERFQSDVEFESLKVSFPVQSPWTVLWNLGRGGRVRLTGKGLVFRLRTRKEPPMFILRQFDCDIDLHSLFNRPTIIERVNLIGMQISIPPKGERPKIQKMVQGPTKAAASGEAETAKAAEAKAASESAPPAVVVKFVKADGTKLTILPRDPKKDPLVWDIQKLELWPAERGVTMDYKATLTNAKPPGLIVSKGQFGPWNGAEPGESPLEGTFVFANADLGVFKGIEGTLHSAGKFHGQLNYFDAVGEARVPNFSLNSARHPINLITKYHAIVDGTNGNTILDPVEAQLGQSRFTCKGEVARREGDSGKRITLEVDMRDARLEDVLFLAMKGDRPFMRGPLKLTTTLEIPPGPGTIAQRLKLHKGKFQIIDAHFTSPTIQQKIDEFSRRGQGSPDKGSVNEVPVRMKGEFQLGGGSIAFSSLQFEIPGAVVDLAGQYGFIEDTIDFLGSVRLDAKVSEMFRGWKKVMLKTVDPFFSKRGAGTYLPIKISGNREKPEFGLAKSDDVDKRLSKP